MRFYARYLSDDLQCVHYYDCFLISYAATDVVSLGLWFLKFKINALAVVQPPYEIYVGEDKHESRISLLNHFCYNRIIGKSK